jgi:RND family efflux transporter MFP subunit
VSKKIIITLFVIIAVGALLMKGKALLHTRQAEISDESVPQTPTLSIPLITPKQGLLQHKVSVLAEVFADKSITLSTKLVGYVEKIHVDEADHVRKGDLLAQVDATELNSNITALKQTLKAQQSDMLLAKKVYASNQKLYNIGGLSKEKLDASAVLLKTKASLLESTKQKIVQLNNQHSYLKIVAPFEGNIDMIMLHEGDLASAGKGILRMSSGEKKLLISYTPHSQATIAPKQQVLLDGEAVGNVKSIYTTAKNGLTTAEITLNRAITQPIGSTLNIDIVTEENEGCLIPTDALLHKKEGTFVMYYHDQKFSLLKVRIEMKDTEQVLISPCPTAPIAQGSEVKLSELLAYDKVEVTGVRP